tara:strand:- start:811 stop:990 length:180 start_codon:yes stop_codon:yes gene_type:complete
VVDLKINMISSTENRCQSLGKETKEDLGFDTELDLELALAPLMQASKNASKGSNEVVFP